MSRYATALQMALCLIKLRKDIEAIIEQEAERPKRTHRFTDKLARMNAEIIECLGEDEEEL